MKKKLLSICVVGILLLLAACGNAPNTDDESNAQTPPPVTDAAQETPAAESNEDENATETRDSDAMTAYRADGTAVVLEDCGDGTTWKDADGLLYYLGTDGVLRARGAEDLYTELPSTEIGRQDGERFEATIVLEGMEETVRYEHIINETAGFEMDYDYEAMVRHSGSGRERFLSVWDDPEHPENYLEVAYRPEDAETAAAAIRKALSQTYELFEEPRELDRAGSCLYIEASVLKGTNLMADQLQAVYLIPASDGCRVATAHFAIEASEGFGHRFRYLLDTLTVKEVLPSDGQNPVMNFIGVYHADDSIEALVEADGMENAKITVTWAGSPWFHTRTVMTGRFDPETLTVEFSSTTLTEYTYKSDGSIGEETVTNTDNRGEAIFSYEANTLTITEEFPSGNIDTVYEWGPAAGMKTVSDPDHYASVTAMDKYQIETVVGFHVRTAYLSENWYALADMIRYPITINGTVLADADAFLGYMIDKTVSESDREAMLDEDLLDVFVNGQGIMLGDGEIWLSDPNDMTDGEPVLEIIAINGIVSRTDQ